MQEKLNVFLKELAELTKKHGFTIGGCGDCGSPWITDDNGKEVLQHLMYAEKDSVYIAYEDHGYGYDENNKWREWVKDEAKTKYGIE